MVPVDFINGDEETLVELSDGSFVTLAVLRLVIHEIDKSYTDPEDYFNYGLWELCRKCDDPDYRITSCYGMKLMRRGIFRGDMRHVEEVGSLVRNSILVSGLEVSITWPTHLSLILVT